MTLTLWPFWDISEDENGFTTPTRLDGVKVCATRARLYGGSWSDFRDVTNVCTDTVTTTANGAEVIILKNVPAMSELIVTAEKDGYHGGVIAVTTGLMDEDTTDETPGHDGMQFALQRSDSPWTRVDPAVQVLPKMGDLSLNLAICSGLDCSQLAGARVALQAPTDAGSPPSATPSYWAAGKFDPLADSTIENGQPGENGTSFVNLIEGDYRLRIIDSLVKCRTAGFFDGNWVHGYASDVNEVRVPVLAGHTTMHAGATCFCDRDLTDPLSVNPQTCAPLAPEGGAP